MPEFNTWFPTSRHGNPEVNVMSFGAIADGTGRPLWSLTAEQAPNAPYANLAAAQVDYPSATSTSDYADWCALTEAIKAAFSTDGVLHGGEGYKNRPLCVPAGRYIVNRPVIINSVSDALIYGTGYWTQIYNETETAGQNTCIKAEGLRYSRIENFTFGAKGPGAIAFDLTNAAGGSFNSHGNVWTTCNFTAIGSETVGCSMGTGGYMGSEQTFIRCTADNNTYGWLVCNPNALSYLFITCLGNLNARAAIRVNTGGGVACINCAFSENGEGHGASGDGVIDGADIDTFATAPVTMINCRSESRHFVRSAGYVYMMGCDHSASSSEVILVHSDSGARITTTHCHQSRLEGEGEFTLDNFVGNYAAYWFQGISNSGGLIKITHTNLDVSSIAGYETWEHWRDGDQVEIQRVEGTTFPTAPSVNGVWTIHKIDRNNFELLNSTYVADTYKNLTTGEPAGTKGYMRPGPRYHLGGLLYARPPNYARRKSGMNSARDTSLVWMDSGTTCTNIGATGAVTFTLPIPSSAHFTNVRGTNYAFVVAEAFPVTIIVPVSGFVPQERLIHSGGTVGMQVTSTGTIGNRIEIQLIDGQGGQDGEPAANVLGSIGYRWLIVSETGTWTLSGTPTP